MYQALFQVLGIHQGTEQRRVCMLDSKYWEGKRKRVWSARGDFTSTARKCLTGKTWRGWGTYPGMEGNLKQREQQCKGFEATRRLEASEQGGGCSRGSQDSGEAKASITWSLWLTGRIWAFTLNDMRSHCRVLSRGMTWTNLCFNRITLSTVLKIYWSQEVMATPQ